MKTPLTLDYYLSINQNPYTEDNHVTQEEINERSDLQFRYDSIVKTIGTSDCRTNIELFFDELMVELDEDQLLLFKQECLRKLIDVYDLEILSYHLSDGYPEYDVKEELKSLLYFFEHNDYIDIIVNCLQVDDPQILLSSDFRTYIEMRHELFIKTLFEKYGTLTFFILEYFRYAGKGEATDLLIKLISKNRSEIISRYYLKLKGV